jgi:uncharacterized protein (UPF0548 family)
MRLLWPGQPLRVAEFEGLEESDGLEGGPGPGETLGPYYRDLGSEQFGEPEPGGLFERAESAILAFRIYPSELMEVRLARPALANGNTLAMGFRIGLGFRLVFGTRVQRVGREFSVGWVRGGFSYRTLNGHPVIGEEWFWVEKELATGRIRLNVHAWSRPGLWITRFGRPFSRLVQRYATSRALDHIQAAAQDSPQAKT